MTPSVLQHGYLSNIPRIIKIKSYFYVFSKILVFINEVDNDQATESIDIAITYIKKNPNLGLSVQLTSLEANATDSKGILAESKCTRLFLILFLINLIIYVKLSVCRVYDAALKSGQPPHIILDTSKSGLASDTIKSFAAQLAIPTISASYGQVGDLRQWRELTDQQKQFLLQVPFNFCSFNV